MFKRTPFGLISAVVEALILAPIYVGMLMLWPKDTIEETRNNFSKPKPPKKVTPSEPTPTYREPMDYRGFVAYSQERHRKNTKDYSLN